MSTAFEQGLASLDQAAPVGTPIRSEFAAEADMKELVDLFVSELPQRTKAITDAYRQQQWDAIKRISHQLKGASAGYGFPSIGSAAAEVEAIFHNGGVNDESSLQSLTATVKQLLTLCKRAM